MFLYQRNIKTLNGIKRIWYICFINEKGKRNSKSTGTENRKAAEIKFSSFNPNDKRTRTTKHGKANSTEYLIWRSMVQRCCNPKAKNYKHYGGRGIKICSEWRNDFMSFYKHIGNRPSPKHSVDRIDNDGNYEPGNVRWATFDVQMANRKRKEIL